MRKINPQLQCVKPFQGLAAAIRFKYFLPGQKIVLVFTSQKQFLAHLCGKQLLEAGVGRQGRAAQGAGGSAKTRPAPALFPGLGQPAQQEPGQKAQRLGRQPGAAKTPKQKLQPSIAAEQLVAALAAEHQVGLLFGLQQGQPAGQQGGVGKGLSAGLQQAGQKPQVFRLEAAQLVSHL